jgi:hypothetical protein
MTSPLTRPRRLVPAPGFQQTPYGLFSVIDDWRSSDHWRWGVEWESNCSTTETIELDPCSPSVTGGFPSTGNRIWKGANAFRVYAEISCSPVDFYARAQDLANEAMTRNEQWEVERTLWEGTTRSAYGQTVSSYPRLASNSNVGTGAPRDVYLQTAATVVSGGVYDPKVGLGVLEDALGACYNGRGVIHVPQMLIPGLAGAGLLIRGVDGLSTHNGNRVVAGAGYSGSGPDGVEPSGASKWMYATGPLLGYRSSIGFNPPETNLDRSVDTVTTLAWRDYLVGWDCCHFGVQVRMDVDADPS